MNFQLGQLVATAGVSNWANSSTDNSRFLASSLSRHSKGDWGDLCEDDKQLNNRAVNEGTRILSSYSNGTEKIWIITEWDRSVTTVLFPSEY